jgi:hypothetical protein
MKLFERIEQALERRDRFDLTNTLRRFEAHFVSGRAQLRWICKQYDTQRQALSLIQRKIYPTEEPEAMEKRGNLKK